MRNVAHLVGCDETTPSGLDRSRDPTVVVPKGAKVTVRLVNADDDMA